ncbi:hypothetical protein ACWGB8_31170 [Kitasatospora sp. NPDC054939]
MPGTTVKTATALGLTAVLGIATLTVAALRSSGTRPASTPSPARCPNWPNCDLAKAAEEPRCPNWPNCG